ERSQHLGEGQTGVPAGSHGSLRASSPAEPPPARVILPESPPSAGQSRSTKGTTGAARLACLSNAVQRWQCGDDAFDLEATRPEIEDHRPDRVRVSVQALERVLQRLLLL